VPSLHKFRNLRHLRVKPGDSRALGMMRKELGKHEGRLDSLSILIPADGKWSGDSESRIFKCECLLSVTRLELEVRPHREHDKYEYVRRCMVWLTMRTSKTRSNDKLFPLSQGTRMTICHAADPCTFIGHRVPKPFT
jgi:hypothetical protein